MLDFKNINPEELANKLGKFYAEATPKPGQKRSEKMKEQVQNITKIPSSPFDLPYIGIFKT